jgi:peptidoglycan/xylan/chitin deacetylase (PgdA/CDA1 family)
VTGRKEGIAAAGKWVGGRAALLLDATFGSRAGGAFGILLYHRVAAEQDGAQPPTMNVTPRRFREQLERLLGAGYQFRPLREVLASALAGYPQPEKTAIVTFDDGYWNTYLHAWPVLRELGVPATVFVVTGCMDSPEPFPFDDWGRRHQRQVPAAAWRPLTWEQCQEMERSGVIEIGSHTHTHRDLRRRPEEFASDLQTSLALLEQRLGPGQRTFSFPFGGVRSGFAGPELVAVVRASGVTCSLTTEIGLVEPDADPFSWGRLEVIDDDTGSIVKAKLDGWYNWMGAAREAFRATVRS